MPAYTLNGFDFERARVTLGAYEIWRATVSLVAAQSLAVGAAAELVIGDLRLTGVLEEGGTYAGVSTYLLAGGAGGWSKPVRARAYRDDRGLTLAQVAADLAAEVGEQLVVEPGADRPLGYAWSRFGGPDPTGIASMALRRLARAAWWVGADGVTHVGQRPASPVPSTVRFVATDYDPSARTATLMSPDDAIAAFVPGAQWSADGIPTFTIACTHIHATAGSVSLTVVG